MGVSRAVGVVAVAAALLTACTADPEPTSAEPTTATGTPAPPPETDPPTEPTAEPLLDPAYAVDPPGRRTEAIGVADVLISSKETLDPDVVRDIEALDGVVTSTTISLVNVPLENKVYNVAAVDPADYRLFTVEGSANFQVQWDRVAGGEAAVSDDLEKTLPLDPGKFLTLGTDEAATVHVGAWAPQVEQIDMVVNEKRGAALGVIPDNALLLHTGQTSPESLRKPIETILDGAAAVTNLDAVARYGLDLDAIQPVVLVGAFADAVGVFNYTPIGGGRIAPDPAWVASHITTEAVPILGTVTCNKAIMPQLKAALAEIQGLGLADEINPGEYAGCYYPRFIAGSTTLSNHSFGLALDLNTLGNQRGTVGEMDRGVVAVFKRWGFAWGGDWNYTDPMHFELDRIVRPG